MVTATIRLRLRPEAKRISGGAQRSTHKQIPPLAHVSVRVLEPGSIIVSMRRCSVEGERQVQRLLCSLQIWTEALRNICGARPQRHCVKFLRVLDLDLRVLICGSTVGVSQTTRLILCVQGVHEQVAGPAARVTMVAPARAEVDLAEFMKRPALRRLALAVVVLAKVRRGPALVVRAADSVAAGVRKMGITTP